MEHIWVYFGGQLISTYGYLPHPLPNYITSTNQFQHLHQPISLPPPTTLFDHLHHPISSPPLPTIFTSAHHPISSPTPPSHVIPYTTHFNTLVVVLQTVQTTKQTKIHLKKCNHKTYRSTAVITLR